MVLCYCLLDSRGFFKLFYCFVYFSEQQTAHIKSRFRLAFFRLYGRYCIKRLNTRFKKPIARWYRLVFWLESRAGISCALRLFELRSASTLVQVASVSKNAPTSAKKNKFIRAEKQTCLKPPLEKVVKTLLRLW